jgi:hypothetical protein
MNRSTQALAEATARRRNTAEQAVTKALREARKTNAPITFSGLAAAAGVSTDFIYRHPELRAQVEALRRVRSPASTASATVADADAAASTLVRRLTQQLTDTRRQHREETAQLRQALAAAHGELIECRRKLDRLQAAQPVCDTV